MNRCARCQHPVQYKYCPTCCKALGIDYNSIWCRIKVVCKDCGEKFKTSQTKPQSFCRDCRDKRRKRVKYSITGRFWKEFYALFGEGQYKKTLNKTIEQMDEMLMDK